MLGLIKDFAITALIIILNHWVYGVEDFYAYDFVLNFISKNQTLFLAIGTLGSGALLFCSTMFEGLGLYKITYGISKVFVRLSQFFITFLTILNMGFYFAINQNLMRDGGYFMLIILFVILGVSCWALRLIDFNYHTRNAMLPVIILALVSVLCVEYIWPMSGI